jgi:preprotein translocase subunit SecY
MQKLIKKIQDVFENKSLKKKIIFTLAMLAVYRLLVFIPVPFVDITALMSKTIDASGSGLGYFVMLL